MSESRNTLRLMSNMCNVGVNHNQIWPPLPEVDKKNAISHMQDIATRFQRLHPHYCYCGWRTNVITVQCRRES